MNKIQVTINDKEYQIEEKFLEWQLVRYLREQLGLTGTKQGCDSEGACGLCKVIINGKAKLSCREKLSALDGGVIETIENLAVNGQPPHPLIQTVIQDGIFQCGYCAPGAILTAKALLDKNRNPTDDDIKAALSGNLCRCTDYIQIIEAVKSAAAKLNGPHRQTNSDE